MKLKCKINEVVYDNIVLGQSFSEEYNETLDSGSIIISHVPMIEDLKPYTDVFIWDSNYDFQGFYNDKILMSGVEYTFDDYDLSFKNENNQKVFFKHLLIDTFNESMINLKNLSNNLGIKGQEPLYEYKIQLFSEAKGLEVVSLPNISLTQPLDIYYKKTAWEIINKYIDMYSPVYKVVLNKNEKIWSFKKKYKVSEKIKKS